MLGTLVYDVTRESVYGGVWFLVAWGLFGLVFIGGGALLDLRAEAVSKASAYTVLGVGVFFFAIAVAFIVSGLVVRQSCADGARAGNFRTTDGVLNSLKRSGKTEPYEYSFALGDRKFVSGGAITSACGLAPPPSSRFKFLEGQHLRIEHQGDRIYRIFFVATADPAVREMVGPG